METERQGAKNKECHAEHERHKSCQWVIKSQSVSKRHLLPLAPITHLPPGALQAFGSYSSLSLSLSELDLYMLVIRINLYLIK